MKFESGEAADFLGHGSASSASAKTHASKLRVPCTTLRSPWLLCRRGFAKTFDEWIVNDSSQCERATEAGFGELLYHDEGLVKAGAHYTGIAHESESFFAKRCRPGEKNQVFQTLSFLPGTVRPRDCGDGSLNVSPISANDQGQVFRRAANCPTFNSGFLWLRLQAALT
ncbi:hypothetical protein [Pseudomonas viridiflava]|uniref:hypothetical protein n=1 Tax=Pseudomonas viridiflava TaxID=33069 RepID=UPI0020BEB209|nr:hypothetical protein [Pseudomonas viridiflava]